MREDTAIQTEEPCIFSRGTQTAYPTANIAVQTDIEENVQFVCVILEESETAMQTDPTET